MKVVTFKSFLWFFVIVLLAFAFPMQVMTASPIISLLPYLGIVSIFALTLSSRSHNGLTRWNTREPITLLISIYLLLVLFQTGWQVVFGFISIEAAVSALVIYVAPVTFFIYFRSVATDKEIRSVFFAIALAGLVTGIYFAYDSYSMLVWGQLNDFSLRAFEYSELRAPTQDISVSRISLGYRSHGLLENHSVSAAWIVLGCFATLSLLPQHATFKRMMVIMLYGLLLLVGLNFTAIVGFVFVVFLLAFRDISLLRGVNPMRGAKSMAIVVSGFILLGAMLFVLIGDEMVEAIQKSLMGQVDFAMGTITVGEDEQTYLGKLVSGLVSFPVNMLQFPPGFLIGDGFSEFGVRSKGGDIGIADTLHRFGLPFFLAIIIGLISLVRRALKQIPLIVPDQFAGARYLWFAVCVTPYLLFTEIHYSVWAAKSILPIFFLALALYKRCLLPRRSKVPASVIFSAQDPYLSAGASVHRSSRNY